MFVCKICITAGLKGVVTLWTKMWINFVLLVPYITVCAVYYSLFSILQFVQYITVCSVYYSLCSILQFVQYITVCAVYCSLCRILWFVPYIAVCAVYCSLCRILQFVPYIAVCAVYCSLCRILQFVPYIAVHWVAWMCGTRIYENAGRPLLKSSKPSDLFFTPNIVAFLSSVSVYTSWNFNDWMRVKLGS